VVKKRAKKPKVETDYLEEVYYLDRYHKMITSAVKTIRRFSKHTHFDAIAFTGTSGAAIAYPLSLRLNKPLICVRKKKEKSHYFGRIEGCVDAKSYIIVDDCVASGRTVKDIVSTISGCKRLKKAKPVGIYLYDTDASLRKTVQKIPRIL
jgi:adenine/guanine phosphoribosyltransferase-like PRPP-binding protein